MSSRGLGISTVTRDALAKARTDAALGAQAAQLSALGQAAGVSQNNATRAQQESQFKRTLGQQKDSANQQMLGRNIEKGAGALAGLAGASFGPEIRGGVRSMFGLGPLRQDAAGGVNGVPAGAMPTSAPTAMPSFDAGSGGGLAGLGNFQMPSTSFGSGDFPATDFGDFGGLDLGALYDVSFPQFDADRWGDFL